MSSTTLWGTAMGTIAFCVDESDGLPLRVPLSEAAVALVGDEDCEQQATYCTYVTKVAFDRLHRYAERF